MTQDRLGLLAELGDLLAGLDLREGELERSLDRAAEAAAVIFGVDGAGLMLRLDDGALRLVGASSASARALEAAQLQLGAGPGFDATERAAVVAVEDLEHSDRWPGLWERLSGCGVRGVLSAPITVRGEPVGNFNLFTHSAHRWDEQSARAILAYAGVVTALLRIALESRHSDALVTRLRAGIEH